MAIVWVTPKKKHYEKREFEVVKLRAIQEFNKFDRTIYIIKNLNYVEKDVYFTLTGKELNLWHQSFENRTWRVVAIIL